MSCYIIAMGIIFYLYEKEWDNQLTRVKVCLGTSIKTWRERLHLFREDLKYAKVLSLYPEGNLENWQVSDIMGQGFSTIVSGCCVCRMASDVGYPGAKQLVRWWEWYWFVRPESWQMWVEEKWCALQPLSIEHLQGLGLVAGSKQEINTR